jgi:hypothetical protein
MLKIILLLGSIGFVDFLAYATKTKLKKIHCIIYQLVASTYSYIIERVIVFLYEWFCGFLIFIYSSNWKWRHNLPFSSRSVLPFSRSISILAMPRRHLHPRHHHHATLLPAYTQPWVKALPQHSTKAFLNPYPSKLFAVLYKYISQPTAGFLYQQLAAACYFGSVDKLKHVIRFDHGYRK